jgi:hypothetical protein
MHRRHTVRQSRTWEQAMRTIVVSCAGALLLWALGQVGCVEEERAPAQAVGPAAAPPEATVVRQHQRPPVTAVQPAQPQPVVQAAPPGAPPQSPPIVDNGIEPSPRAPGGAATNIAPPAYGATEAQGQMLPEQEERSRASEVVAQATDQIDRLQRIQSMSADAHREGLDNALYDLEHRREKVLQDMRELDLQPPEQRRAIRAELQRDVADLQASLHAAYRISPPPSKGLPPPAPLPPR